jgi:two-component system chemotaxis sensor kinase CheA
MSHIDERLIQILTKTIAELRSLDDADKDAIISIGATLEEALQIDSSSVPRLDEILGLSLEALQAVYLGNVSDTYKTVQSIIESLSVVQQCLSVDEITDMDRPFDMAYQVLMTALGRELTGNDSVEGVGPADAVQVTLDDIAARLVQIEPTDKDRLIWARNTLESLCEQENYPENAQNLVSEAVQVINSFDTTGSPDGEATITKVGELIEAIINAIEEPLAVCEAVEPSPADVEVQEPVQTVAKGPVAEPVPPQITAEVDDSESEEEMLPQDADKDLLGDFVTECREYIEGAEAALLTLESEPEDAEAVNTVFRAFHTIKGTSAFLGLTRISELAHRAESLLSRVRDGEIRCTGGYADLALRSVDTLKDLMQGVQDALGGEPMVRPAGYNELMANLLILRLMEYPVSPLQMKQCQE